MSTATKSPEVSQDRKPEQVSAAAAASVDEFNEEDAAMQAAVVKSITKLLIEAADIYTAEITRRRRRQSVAAAITESDETDSQMFPFNGGSADAASGFGSSIMLIRTMAQRLQELVDTPNGIRLVGEMAAHWGQILKFVGDLAVVLVPVALVCSISVIICQFDRQRQANNTREWYAEDMKRINDQIAKLNDCIQNICQMVSDAHDIIERLNEIQNPERWLPAETEHFNGLLIDIHSEIEAAKVRFKTSKKWLTELGEKLEADQRRLALRNLLLWVGAACFAGVVWKRGLVEIHTAVATALAGGIPFCHTVLRMSLDVNNMLNEIHRKEMLNEELEVEMFDYEQKLKRLRRRRFGRCVSVNETAMTTTTTLDHA